MEFGPMHFLVVGVIALIFFGPSRLPTLGRSLGEAIRGFKKAMDGSDADSESAKRDIELERLRAAAAISMQKSNDATITDVGTTNEKVVDPVGTSRKS
jgi:sec-independent protein translocase protein TatA